MLRTMLLIVCCLALVPIMADSAAGSSPDGRHRHIAAVASATAKGDLGKLATALADGLDSGLTVSEAKEVLVQLYAYTGFPRSLNGLATLMRVLEERKRRGVSDKAGKDPSPMPPDRSSLAIGTENQTKLAGRPVTGPLYEFAPAIDRFLKAHLFGDIFQRDNLSWQDREVATIAALASMEGVNPQLQAHCGIGMNTGLTPSQIEQILAVVEDMAGASFGANARAVLNAAITARRK